MITALFARADHPSGYAANGPTEYFDLEERAWTTEWASTLSGAHGYSIVAVTGIRNVDELQAVVERMYRRFSLPDGDPENQESKMVRRVYQWYGGRFDFIGAISGKNLSIMNKDYSLTTTYNSYGDNRFFGIYTVEEVLGGGYRKDGQYHGL